MQGFCNTCSGFHIEKTESAFFLISSMVLDLSQWQIFLQLFMIELVGLLTGLGLLEL